MRHLYSAVAMVATTLVLAFAASAPAQAKKEPLVLQVKAAIERGVRQLKQLQRPDGRWTENIPSQEGGMSSLALLALLNAGVPVEDDCVQKGLASLRRLEPGTTSTSAPCKPWCLWKRARSSIASASRTTLSG